MKIKINSEEKTFEKVKTLSEVIQKELNGKSIEGIAVALNYNVVHRTDWDKTSVNENDEIEIVTAVQGG